MSNPWINILLQTNSLRNLQFAAKFYFHFKLTKRYKNSESLCFFSLLLIILSNPFCIYPIAYFLRHNRFLYCCIFCISQHCNSLRNPYARKFSILLQNSFIIANSPDTGFSFAATKPLIPYSETYPLIFFHSLDVVFFFVSIKPLIPYFETYLLLLSPSLQNFWLLWNPKLAMQSR